jgi:thiol-disulfide isomerase/thioredoxin
MLWIALAAIAVALALLVWRGRGRSDAASHAAVGQRLGFVQLEPLTGEASPITAAELQGQVTLINFWGPWCGFCLEEMPHLVRLREKFAERSDVQFLFVSCSPDWQPNTPPAFGWSENLAQLRASTAELLAERGYNIPTYVDPHGKTRQAFAGLDTWEGYPTTLLIDRDGVIRFVSIGYVPGDEHALEEQLRKVINTPPGERGT